VKLYHHLSAALALSRAARKAQIRLEKSQYAVRRAIGKKKAPPARPMTPDMWRASGAAGETKSAFK
jgi:hypothetical protein